ncbi:MAG: EamA family transporter [Victivallales bacterium]
MGLTYAICSLGFAGVNDVVFRKYGQKSRPVGILLALIGIVWASFFFTMAAVKGRLEIDLATVVMGSVAGIFSASANILLIEGMKRTGASVASTIYRLNLIFVAILAFVLLCEPIGLFKLGGLVCAIAAVVLFSMPEDRRSRSNIALKFIMILLLASFLRACMGISYKLASTYGINDEIFLAVNGLCWIVSGALYTFLRERDIGSNRSVLKYSLISGLLICGIVFFLKLAVNSMDASVAVTVSQFSFLVTAPLAVFFMNERITVKKALGMSLSVVCIIVFSFAK